MTFVCVCLQPAPAEHMPAKTPSSIHLVPLPPRYKQGPDPMDLPCVPFAPTLNRPRARRAMIPSGNAKTGPSATALASAAKSAPTLGGDVMQAGKWVTWAMAAIHEDRVGPLIQALASPLADLRCRVRGGGYGLPYSLGPVYSFFVESHFRRENKAALARLDGRNVLWFSKIGHLSFLKYFQLFIVVRRSNFSPSFFPDSSSFSLAFFGVVAHLLSYKLPTYNSGHRCRRQVPYPQRHFEDARASYLAPAACRR